VLTSKSVSAAHDKPIPKWSLALAALIAYYTIFKLSKIVSTGHIKVPSPLNFKAASPPFPLTILFLTLASMFAARK
jgi:hypothetical protein